MIDLSKILVLNKPKNWTSNDAIQKVKKIFNVKKIGHAGTLDPMATGVLVVGINNQTKELGNLTLDSKEYLATIQFGKETDTFDHTGKLISTKDYKNITIEKIKEKLDFLKKEYFQNVPKYSAVKVNGKKLYEYARKNELVNLPSRKVRLYEYKIVSYNNISGVLLIQIIVSKGFYVRSLASDLGSMLDSCAHLSDLIRTKSGRFDIKDSYTINQLFLEKKIEELNLNEKLIEKEDKKLIIGYFDGIHYGHLKLFENLEPKSFNVLTFKNIPRKNHNLFSYYDRIEQILSLGAKKVFVYDLSKNNTNATTFINKILKPISPSEIIVGSDFVFGNDHANWEILKKNLIKVKTIKTDDNFKSSKIRLLVSDGKFEDANKMLVNQHYFSGIVCHGNAFGRVIKTPTINFFSQDKIIKIRNGSYVSLTMINNIWYHSMTCVNMKDNQQIFETNIISDFNENVYGMEVKVKLLKFIRDYQKVSNVKELVKLIGNDLKYTKKYLKLNYAK